MKNETAGTKTKTDLEGLRRRADGIAENGLDLTAEQLTVGENWAGGCEYYRVVRRDFDR